MRVLYFHQHFTTPGGASGTRSYEFARRLVEHGHAVTVVCGSSAVGDTGLTEAMQGGRREGDVDGIHVIELALPYSNRDSLVRRATTFLRFALRSVRIALTRDADIVFATSTPLTASIPGIFAKLLRRRRFVFEVRDLWPEVPKAMGVIRNPFVLGALSALEWLSYRCADRCVALAPGIVKGIVKRGMPADRVHFVPNGCDLDLFHPSKRDRSLLGDSKEGRFVALFAGAHGIANGLDAVLDAARVLLDRGRSDVEILFVGDGKRKPHLVARAEREGLANCRFHDPVPKHQMAAITASVDAGLQLAQNVPAFYEGTSPNKFFDYIAAGIPVIDNYPGWLAGLITEARAGLAVAPDDPHALADALIALADDRAAAREMGRHARALAESRFSRDALASEFMRVLEMTVNE